MQHRAGGRLPSIRGGWRYERCLQRLRPSTVLRASLGTRNTTCRGNLSTTGSRGDRGDEAARASARAASSLFVRPHRFEECAGECATSVRRVCDEGATSVMFPSKGLRTPIEMALSARIPVDPRSFERYAIRCTGTVARRALPARFEARGGPTRRSTFRWGGGEKTCSARNLLASREIGRIPRLLRVPAHDQEALRRPRHSLLRLGRVRRLWAHVGVIAGT
jgi:hypothetical protein